MRGKDSRVVRKEGGKGERREDRGKKERLIWPARR